MNSIAFLWKWCFVDECSTATALLSLSFAINSIFAGLSLSRFNITVWMKNKACKYIAGIAGAEFLEKLERFGKDNKEIEQKLQAFANHVEQFTLSLQDNISRWNHACRLVTICCAVVSVLLIAFETKTRIGLTLPVPCLLLLLLYAICSWIRSVGIKVRYWKLRDAMREAEKSSKDEFNQDACLKKIKSCQEILLKQDGE